MQIVSFFQKLSKEAIHMIIAVFTSIVDAVIDFINMIKNKKEV